MDLMRFRLLVLIFGLLVAGGGVWSWLRETKFGPPIKNEPIASSIEKFVNETISKDREAQAPPETTGVVKSTTKNISAPPSRASTEVCPGEQESDFDCYEKYYTELVQTQSIKIAFSDLKTRYETNGYVVSQCHPLTHVLGRVNSQKYQEVADSYVEGDSFCWSGYYHGVMEGIIGRIGYSNLVAQMDGICASLAATQKYRFDHYNCVHGLGHGVMAITNDELFESLEICDALTDSWERASCWSGVFMENIIIDGLNHVTNYLRPSEPLYPCNAVGDQYKSTCYLMQTSYMLKVTNGDFTKVFALCTEVERAHQSTCYQSLGRDISGRSNSSVPAALHGCGLGRDLEQRTHCIIGAVKDFISYFHSDTQAKELCAALTEKEIQDTCFETAKGYYQLF